MFSPLALTIAIALTISLILSFHCLLHSAASFNCGSGRYKTNSKNKDAICQVLKKVLVNQKKMVTIAVGFFVASIITIHF